jgi:hypothetical protein
MSPTSLKCFQDCPEKYRAQYVARLFKPKEGPAMARGSAIHKAMEYELKGLANCWPKGEATAYENTRAIVQDIADLKAEGWTVETELSLATDGRGQSVDFFNNAGYARCKVDALLISPRQEVLTVLDWKTGKTPGNADQLAINALCLAPRFGLGTYQVAFVYVDLGRTDWDTVRVDVGAPMDLTPGEIAASSIGQTIMAIRDARLACASGKFVPTPSSQACRWCEHPSCQYRY